MGDKEKMEDKPKVTKKHQQKLYQLKSQMLLLKKRQLKLRLLLKKLSEQ